MSNLLPKETLEIVWRRFYRRILYAGALVFLFTAVFAGLALLPSYIAPKIEKGLLKESAVLASKAEINPQSRAEINDILRSQAILARVSPVISATSSAADLLTAALLLRPRGISVNRLSFVSGQNGTIVIEGIAPGREEINLYREELSKNERFSSISVPVGALLGAEGGKFTITVKGAF